MEANANQCIEAKSITGISECSEPFLIRVMMSAKFGLGVLGFEDDAQYVVASRMLTHGSHLYRDVFTHQGTALPAVASAAVARSPRLKAWPARACGVGLCIGFPSAVWVLVIRYWCYISQSLNFF